MRILLDGRMMYMSGIGRYIRDLIKSLVSDSEVSLTVATSRKNISQYIRSEYVPKNLQFAEYDAPIYSLREQALGYRFFNRLSHKYDIVHFPHYNVPFKVPENSIVTIHDLIQFSHISVSPLKLRFARVILNRALTAKRILTVSNTVALEIKAQFPQSAEKIMTVYPTVINEFKPVDINCASIILEKYNIKHPFILYVGNRKPHKNLSTLLEAHRELLKTSLDVQLVILGKKFAEDGVHADVNHKVFVLENISDMELPAFYSAASVLVMPSFVEGFGYPPLEAIACGTKVIASDISVFRETLEDCVVFFDPHSAIDLASKIRMCFNESTDIKKVPKILARTLQEVSKEFLSCYREVIR